MTMRYEVQEFCLFGGWTNTWSHEDDDGNEIPTQYDTKEEAEIDLDYFFQDMQHAFDDGHMEDVPDREDFRVVEVEDEVL
jgi:hypothetical protein